MPSDLQGRGCRFPLHPNDFSFEPGDSRFQVVPDREARMAPGCPHGGTTASEGWEANSPPGALDSFHRLNLQDVSGTRCAPRLKA